MGVFDGLAATDEDVAVIGGTDWSRLVQQPVLAAGRDGAALLASPWALTSASNDFGAQGVGAGHVCWLEIGQAGDATQPYPRALLGVDSASGHTLTLRPLGLASGAGIGPGGAGNAASIRFRVATALPLITRCERDVLAALRLEGDSDLESVSEINRVVCYGVLRDLCRDEARMVTDDGKDHWAKKALSYEKAYKDELERLMGKYGPSPAGTAPSASGVMEDDLTGLPALWWRDDG